MRAGWSGESDPNFRIRHFWLAVVLVVLAMAVRISLIAAAPRPGFNSLPMSQGVILPPGEIRYRVVSKTHSEEEYLKVGRVAAQGLVDLVAGFSDLADRELMVLDFGCGCARTLQPLHVMAPRWTLYGTDVDRVAIHWSEAHIPYATFCVNHERPPTCYSDGAFDLVYALSVFTHLDLEMERAWIAELTRLLKPGGLLYLTFNGQYVLDYLPAEFPDEVVERYKREGFAYFANIDDKILPDWYQTSIQSPAFLASQLPLDSSVVRHRTAAGQGGLQDGMLVRRNA
jgi:2-polyprenyl-3-methyl-5-hydroxy-6-metoxy-1,4-benzoquinol methylase